MGFGETSKKFPVMPRGASLSASCPSDSCSFSSLVKRLNVNVQFISRGVGVCGSECVGVYGGVWGCGGTVGLCVGV